MERRQKTCFGDGRKGSLERQRVRGDTEPDGSQRAQLSLRVKGYNP